eukprot:Gb_11088 [translate_table: standard]
MCRGTSFWVLVWPIVISLSLLASPDQVAPLLEDVSDFTSKQISRASPRTSSATTASKASTPPSFGPVLIGPKDPTSESPSEGSSSREALASITSATKRKRSTSTGQPRSTRQKL